MNKNILLKYIIIEVGSFCDSELLRIVRVILKVVWNERPALYILTSLTSLCLLSK